MTDNKLAEVERLAAEFHDIYQQEAKRQGDVRHKDAYAELPENAKEVDRVLARHVSRLLDAEHADALRAVESEIATSTGQIGGWLDSPKALMAAIRFRLTTQQPSPKGD